MAIYHLDWLVAQPSTIPADPSRNCCEGLWFDERSLRQISHWLASVEDPPGAPPVVHLVAASSWSLSMSSAVPSNRSCSSLDAKLPDQFLILDRVL